MERSARDQVSKKTQVFEEKKMVRIDPRFNDQVSKFNPVQFQATYGFLNSMRQNENKLLRKEIRKKKKKKLGMDEEGENLNQMMIHNKKAISEFKHNELVFKAKAELKKQIRNNGTKMNQTQYKKMISDEVKKLKSKKGGRNFKRPKK